MDWLAQCQDNVIEWDNRSWCWWPGVPIDYLFRNTNYQDFIRKQIASAIYLETHHKDIVAKDISLTIYF